ncbi:MAG: aldo/keto reductase [Candidatus Andersenbacteria bacterium]|nr:aldo/keto reductase [Candidatus Andersenbacteria bacterium]
MKNVLGKTGLKVSRIGLGTVEIGLAYGLKNEGLPSEQDAITLLKTVVEIGITYIDTARGYGLAEERIGKSEIGKNDQIIIGTKFGQFIKNEPNLRGSDLEKRIREDIDLSRKKLNKETLQLAQFHNELEDYTNFSEIIEIAEKLKNEQKIQHVGIAVRGEAAALAAIKTGFFETIQLANNIVDQRMVQNVLKKARENNIGIINRSVLLKGALTPARASLPDALAELKQKADKAEAIAKNLGVDLPTLAIRYVLSQSAVSTALIGTVKANRIESALQALTQGPLPEEVLIQFQELAIADSAQIDPAKWPKVD